MFIFPVSHWSSAAASAGILQSAPQQGEITIPAGSTSNTLTISSVTTANTVLLFDGWQTDNTGSQGRELFPIIALTNSTTITATRNTSNVSFGVTVRFTVVEFKSSAITSIQSGTISNGSGGTTATATITSVNTARAVTFIYGFTTTGASTTYTSMMNRLDLTNSTTVTSTKNASGSALTVGYAVVEFAAGIINSIQQRAVTLTTANTSDTDTITSVTMANTMLVYTGTSSSSNSADNSLYTLQLASATQVTLTRGSISTNTRTIGYTVVEFVSGILNSVQRGTTPMNSVNSADTTITSVNTAKSACNFCGFVAISGGTDTRWSTVKLLDATHVRCQRNTAGAVTMTPAWEIVEFV